MRITCQNVKTVYQITFTLNELLEAFKVHKTHPLKGVGEYKNAFKDITDDTPIKELDNILIHLNDNRKTNTLNFIVKQYFKFDGIENYGLYDETKKVYKMTVYNCGDCINQ